MRPELLYNPLLLLERLGQWAVKKQRLKKLHGTVAASLTAKHIDSLELLELLRPLNPKVIYDIGANVGTWTLLCKALYPEVQIHAFEPLPIHIEKFKQLTNGLIGVHLHEVGLGSLTTKINMKVTDFSDASSLLALTETGKQQWHLQQVGEIPVQIERLDDWISSHGLPSPDLIKMDVQGFELEVLRGAEQCLTQAKGVLLETSFKNFYERQCRFDELVSFLANAGFYVRAFGHGTSLGRPLVQADVLFARPDSSNKANKPVTNT
jgi:FkbM family methyltransferase